MNPKLPNRAGVFVTALTAVNPPPESIWLIGSRANGRETEVSDTDLLVFGSPAFLAALEAQVLAPTELDCLVVYDGDNFRDPWKMKNGSLTKLNWRTTDESNAEYIGAKWTSDEESSLKFGADMGELTCLKELGVRIWAANKPLKNLLML